MTIIFVVDAGWHGRFKTFLLLFKKTFIIVFVFPVSRKLEKFKSYFWPCTLMNYISWEVPASYPGQFALSEWPEEAPRTTGNETGEVLFKFLASNFFIHLYSHKSRQWYPVGACVPYVQRPVSLCPRILSIWNQSLRMAICRHQSRSHLWFQEQIVPSSRVRSKL